MNSYEIEYKASRTSDTKIIPFADTTLDFVQLYADLLINCGAYSADIVIITPPAKVSFLWPVLGVMIFLMIVAFVLGRVVGVW